MSADPEEVEKLEMEVREMAQKIIQYRETLPDQLKSTLASVLEAQRPVFSDGLEPGNPKLSRVLLALRFVVFSVFCFT